MKQLDYAIVFVSDMKRSVAFYRDVLGLPLKFETPHWTEFLNEGSTIALHLANEKNPAGQCQIGFPVDNLDQTHQQLQSKGVQCLMPPRTEEFGIRQAVYTDPDGLRITLAQPLKE